MQGELAPPVRDGNVVYVGRFGGRAAEGGKRVDPQVEREAARRAAMGRLNALLAPGALVHAVMRFQDPECDWLVCDFYLIAGEEVTCLTPDVALAIDHHDPEREIGMRLHRPARGSALTQAIDLRLSRALFGEPGLLRHRAIG